MTRATILLGVAAGLALAQAPSDHPAVSSYPGSRILIHRFAEFDEYAMPILVDGRTEEIQLEGAVTRLQYRNPVGRSAVEIFRNYADAFRGKGAEIRYECGPDRCAAWPLPKVQRLTNMGSRGFHGLVARFRHRGRETHAILAVAESVTWLHVVEAKAMESGLVTVDARALADAIERTGKVDIYSILFDTGRAAIKPESRPSLEQIAQMLKDKPELNLDIVGHTDDTGTPEGNDRLSAERAKNVVADLIQTYGIRAARLRASGAGQRQPVAPNEGEPARARNRRVELVRAR